MSDSGYVIKDKDGFYFAGLNVWDRQLRKAKIYHSTIYAREVIEQYRYKNRRAYLVKVKIIEESE